MGRSPTLSEGSGVSASSAYVHEERASEAVFRSPPYKSLYTPGGHDI